MAAITDYDTLVEAIVDQMNDASLDGDVPGFVQMAEAMFNRRLDNLDMEGTATIDADADLPLPTDYKGSMSIRIDDKPPLSQLSADDFQTRWSEASAAEPENFSIFGGLIHLGPEPDTTYTVTMTYMRTLTGLSSTNTTNWLLEQHPDLYLYGSLMHAEFRGWNDDRLPTIGNAVEQIIAEINRYNARRKRGDLVGTVEATYF